MSDASNPTSPLRNSIFGSVTSLVVAPAPGCDHLAPGADAYARFASGGTVLCHDCHESALSATTSCPVCGADLDPTVFCSVITEALGERRLGRAGYSVSVTLNDYVCAGCHAEHSLIEAASDD